MLVLAAICVLNVWASETDHTPKPKVSLTLIPPSPVTDQIQLGIRGSVRNDGPAARTFDLSFYLDEEAAGHTLHQESLEVPPGSAAGVAFRWPTRGNAGERRLLLVARSADEVMRMDRTLRIIASETSSPRRLGGAWVDIYHHDPQEGLPFNEELGQMTDRNWRELVRAMQATDQNLLVITMLFQNFAHRGQHTFTPETYPGKDCFHVRAFFVRSSLVR